MYGSMNSQYYFRCKSQSPLHFLEGIKNHFFSPCCNNPKKFRGDTTYERTGFFCKKMFKEELVKNAVDQEPILGVRVNTQRRSVTPVTQRLILKLLSILPLFYASGSVSVLNVTCKQLSSCIFRI